MESLKNSLFEKLMQKTKELGRRVSFSEMQEDPAMPNPNQYAFYYGSFDEASKMAELKMKLAGKAELKEGGDLGVSKKKQNGLGEERTKVILSEITDMYIAADGRMPSQRDIKKSRYISEKEVDTLRRSGELNEIVIRRLAEEKTGKKYLNPQERRKQEVNQTHQKRLDLIVGKDNLDEAKEVEKMSENIEKVEEAKKVEEPGRIEKPEKPEKELKHVYKRWTADEVKKIISEHYEANGHLPTDAWLKDSADAPSVMTVKKYLGNTREEWLKAIGVEEPEKTKSPMTNIKTETCEVEKELINIIGQDGKLKQLGDMSDLMADIKIEKQFILRFGRIRAVINLSATIEE